MVSTHLKNISQIGLSSQVGVKIKNIWNHQLEKSISSHLETYPKKKLESIPVALFADVKTRVDLLLFGGWIPKYSYQMVVKNDDLPW